MRTGPFGPVFVPLRPLPAASEIYLARTDCCTDRGVTVLHIVAQSLERTDQDNGDKCRNQTVFNSRCTRLTIAQLFHEFFHWTFPSYMHPRAKTYGVFVVSRWVYISQQV